MPNLGMFGGVNWHVPIDDEHHWEYAFWTAPRTLVGELTPDYRLLRNGKNRYLQDREEMKTATYSGIGPSNYPQDACVTDGEGPIQDRTQEHLGYSDRGIVAARQLMLRAIRMVQEGQDPPHVIRDSRVNQFSHMVSRSDLIPAGTDWKEHWKVGASGRPD